MRIRRQLRYHGLKRPKIRQTWNKYNLYNMSRMKMPNFDSRTFFQQKWTAKAMLRAYHGDHIKEKVWERMFSRRINTVVNMDPAYMAEYDGSEQASGRGSGRETGSELARRGRPDRNAPGNKKSGTDPTPYMQMVFAPMERRLDIAIFRAMFASSARQARQFVIHGTVKVNGKQMKYPGYLLNPGDMFQVDPDRVLFATGVQKPKPRRRRRYIQSSTKTASDKPAETEVEAESATAEGMTASNSTVIPHSEESPDENAAKAAERARYAIQSFRSRVKARLSKDVSLDPLPMKTFFYSVLRLRRSNAGSSALSEKSIADLFNKLVLNPPPPSSQDKDATAQPAPTNDPLALTPTERQRLEEFLENPRDWTKPYKTPWEPRPYMAPFAHIPRYLEVNQRICSAVYLRHPVARQGYAEVPTPFPPSIGQLAFNWYLKRR